jgi:hypothetical protein
VLPINANFFGDDQKTGRKRKRTIEKKETAHIAI